QGPGAPFLDRRPGALYTQTQQDITEETQMQSILKNPALAPEGEKKIRWAQRHMPVLSLIRERFSREKPLRGLSMAVSVHLEAKTACLCQTLAAGGAEVWAMGSNPLSTQDDV